MCILLFISSSLRTAECENGQEEDLHSWSNLIYKTKYRRMNKVVSLHFWRIHSFALGRGRPLFIIFVKIDKVPARLWAPIGFLDARSGVVRVLFSRIWRVDHNSALDKSFDNAPLLDIEFLAFILAEVDVRYGQEFLTAFREMGPYLLFAWVVFEGKDLQSYNLFRPTELLNSIVI
jgi:hypothetical protein